MLLNTLEDHPSRADIENLLRGRSSPEAGEPNASVVRHLLKGCSTCQESVRESGTRNGLGQMLQIESLKSDPESRPASFNYDWAFAKVNRTVQAFLAGALREAGRSEFPIELADLPEQEQVRRVSTGGTFSSPEMIRQLVHASYAVRYRDVSQMLHRANLARLAAESSTVALAGDEQRLADLRAWAWAQYGNSLRVCERLQESEEALGTAERYRARGTGDPRLKADLLSKVAPFLLYRNQFQKSIERIEEARRICQEIGDKKDLARALVQEAVCCIYANEPERATGALQRAIRLIDRKEAPRLLLAAHHNLVRCYIDLGRPEEALTVYYKARHLYRSLDDPLIVLRATWQEGKLLREIGHFRNAESALLRARKGFYERDLLYEVAEICLDLAEVYSRTGRPEDQARMIEETKVLRETLGLGSDKPSELQSVFGLSPGSP